MGSGGTPWAREVLEPIAVEEGLTLQYVMFTRGGKASPQRVVEGVGSVPTLMAGRGGPAPGAPARVSRGAASRRISMQPDRVGEGR